MSQDAGTVVIGAGLAGAHVVQGLRDGGYDKPVTLVGEERERPYERPALSKDYLQGKAELSSLYVHDEIWYGQQAISTRFADAAVSIDRAARRVVLASGESLTYEDLVLATGSSPRTPSIPGVNLAGVHLLRTRVQSDALRAALVTGAKVVVIGAGWIGLEVAAAAQLAGCEVTVLEFAQVPLSRALGDTMGRYVADLHRSHGVDLRTGVTVTGIVGENGTAAAVESDAGRFAADVVMLGVGVRPNDELAAAAGIIVDNGIVVDEHLRSSDSAVLAVGDVANAFNVTMGTQLRVEHWDNAIRQGKLAARVILGGPDSYDWAPYFYTDQFDFGMEYVGRSAADDELVVRGDLASGAFLAFWLRNGLVTAAMNVNTWDVNDELRAMLGHPLAPL